MTWTIEEIPGGKTACSVTGSWKLESCFEIVAAFVLILGILYAVALGVGKKEYDDKNEEDTKAGIDISGRKKYEEEPLTIMRIIGTICLFGISLAFWVWARCGNSRKPIHKMN